jgi:heme-degrading monooxygenase HmoA
MVMSKSKFALADVHSFDKPVPMQAYGKVPQRYIHGGGRSLKQLDSPRDVGPQKFGRFSGYIGVLTSYAQRRDSFLIVSCDSIRQVKACSRRNKMALISVTRLRIRSFLYLPQFMWDTLKTLRQVKRSSGFVGGRLLINAKYVFWTMTVWKDQAAMNAYRTGGAHRNAMPKLLNWCDEAAIVHWTEESADIPVWQTAKEHIVNEGRLSKVNHPSRAQVSNHIPGPEPSRIQSEIKPVLSV